MVKNYFNYFQYRNSEDKIKIFNPIVIYDEIK